jgi:hypothetical protein
MDESEDGLRTQRLQVKGENILKRLLRVFVAYTTHTHHVALYRRLAQLHPDPYPHSIQHRMRSCLPPSSGRC